MKKLLALGIIAACAAIVQTRGVAAQEIPAPLPMPDPLPMPMPLPIPSPQPLPMPLPLPTPMPIPLPTPMPLPIPGPPPPMPNPDIPRGPFPPPPNFPQFTVPMILNCLSDQAYREQNPACVESVMHRFFTTFSLTKEFRGELAPAIVAQPAASPEKQQLRTLRDQTIDADRLMKAGKYQQAQDEYQSVYNQIKDDPIVPDAAKRDLRGVITLAEGSARLSNNDFSQASDSFREAAAAAAPQSQVQAAALVDRALVEIQREHEDTALTLLQSALSASPSADQRSFIQMTIGRTLTNIRGFRDTEAYDNLEAAITEAAAADQKALANIAYADAVRHIDTAKAMQYLDAAAAVCSEKTGCTQNTIDSVQKFRDAWSG